MKQNNDFSLQKPSFREFSKLVVFYVFSILENIIEYLLEQYREQNLYFLYFREVVVDALSIPKVMM